MLYEICYHGNAGIDTIQADSRAEVERILREGWENFQRFSVHETGHIMVYAIELTEQNGRDKRTAALYYDEELQPIWLLFE